MTDLKKAIEDKLLSYSRQSIQTKYFGPTNHSNGRVKATAADGSITMIWDHSLEIYENHTLAAMKLCEKFNWTYSKLAIGGHPKDGYVFILIDKGIVNAKKED